MVGRDEQLVLGDVDASGAPAPDRPIAAFRPPVGPSAPESPHAKREAARFRNFEALLRRFYTAPPGPHARTHAGRLTWTLLSDGIDGPEDVEVTVEEALGVAPEPSPRPSMDVAEPTVPGGGGGAGASARAGTGAAASTSRAAENAAAFQHAVDCGASPAALGGCSSAAQPGPEPSGSAHGIDPEAVWASESAEPPPEPPPPPRATQEVSAEAVAKVVDATRRLRGAMAASAAVEADRRRRGLARDGAAVALTGAAFDALLAEAEDEDDGRPELLAAALERLAVRSCKASRHRPLLCA